MNFQELTQTPITRFRWESVEERIWSIRMGRQRTLTAFARFLEEMYALRRRHGFGGMRIWSEAKIPVSYEVD